MIISLSACGKQNNTTTNIDNKNTQSNKEISENNINMLDTLKEDKKVIQQMWVTWEKLQQIIKKQEQTYKEKLKTLTWENKTTYVLENFALPKISQLKITPKDCKKYTRDIYWFNNCLMKNKINPDIYEKYISKELVSNMKNKYYQRVYKFNPKRLLEGTTDPIAINQKKQEIELLISENRLKLNDCNRLPEQETKDYCKSLLLKK